MLITELLDIVSERFRCVGMARLHLEAFLRIINLPNAACYKARISYIPVKNPEIKQETMLRYRQMFCFKFTLTVTFPVLIIL